VASVVTARLVLVRRRRRRKGVVVVRDIHLEQKFVGRLSRECPVGNLGVAEIAGLSL